MSNQEVLTKAIKKAIAGGWSDYNSLESLELVNNTANTVTLKGWVEYVDEGGNSDESQTEIRFHYKELIFNHDFAKALWPWDDTIKCPYCGICLTGSLMHPRPCPFGVAEVFAQPMWQYHLQQMVVADDPIQYLADHI